MAYYKVPTTTKVISMLNQRGRLEKVIDLVSTLPSNPNQGDRYIDLNDNKVKEYDGSTWQEYTPNQGDNLYVLNRDRYYYFNGSEWVDLVSTASLWEQTGDTLTPKTADNIQINGSFIGDGSQLTGIKKLIADFVAQGNVTAGDVVAFVNGKVRKGKLVSSDSISNQGDEYIFNEGDCYDISSVLLSSNKFVVAWANGSSGFTDSGAVAVGEINGTEVVFGSEYVFSNGSVWRPCVSSLTDSKIVITYSVGGQGKAIIGDISGFDVVFGNEYLFEEGNAREPKSISLTASKFVIVYYVDDQGKALIGEVNGTEIVFGDKYVFNNGEPIDYPFLSKLNDSKFVISYCDVGYTNRYDGAVVVATVEGTAINFGNKYIYDTSEIYYSGPIVSLSETKFVIAYCDHGEGQVGRIVVGEVNDTEVSFGNIYTFYNDVVFYRISCSALDDSSVVVCYRNTNDYYGRCKICKISGFEVTFGDEYIFNNNLTTYISSCSASNYKFLISYKDKNNDVLNGKTTVCEIFSGEPLQYIGIAQETKNDGETVKVLIQGISPVHNSLTVGQKYYATEGGDLTDQETADYLGIAISPTELLLLDWQRPKTIYDETEDVFYMPT